MKVRILARISGARNGAEWPSPGEVIDVPADEAADLIRMGLAAGEKAAPEVASAPEPETAAAPKPRRTRKDV